MNPSVRITDPRRPSAAATVRAYVELTKPRIIELLLTTTLPAMILAAEGWPGWWLAIATLVGGTLSAAGANVINQVMDADIDRVMRRTRGRPLPTHRVSEQSAMIFGIILGVAGFVWLLVTTNVLAASLSTAGLLFYVLVYTLVLKRTSTQNIVIGGAAGAMPPLVGWAAVTGTLAVPAWVLLAIVFFWTPPHFWALALRYDEDYRAARVPMLPGVVGISMTTDHILLYSIVTVGVSLLLVPWVGWIYLAAVAVLGTWLIAGPFTFEEIRTWRCATSPPRTATWQGSSLPSLSMCWCWDESDAICLQIPGSRRRTGVRLMSTVDFVVLLVGSVLMIGGLVAIVARELGTHPERRLVGPVRDGTEVLLPLCGAVVLVVSVWISVS